MYRDAHVKMMMATAKALKHRKFSLLNTPFEGISINYVLIDLVVHRDLHRFQDDVVHPVFSIEDESPGSFIYLIAH